MKLRLGNHTDSGKAAYLNAKLLDRHLHLVGATGSGKTTALITLLIETFTTFTQQRAVFIIDRLGGFSLDLLRWFSSEFCPPWVRDRLVYIEAANERISCPFNPLRFTTPGECYFRTSRTAELVLRGWDSQDLSQMPRLARWMFAAFYAMALLGLPVSAARILLFPGTAQHERLLSILPDGLRGEWNSVFRNNSEAERQLESTRNRLRPIFGSPQVRTSFSSYENYRDVGRFMDEKKIVILNLAQKGLVDTQSADLEGGMLVNEVLNVARSREPHERVETLLVLDEFQRFVMGTDLEFALAESRQMKVNLWLSHQSMSQLVTDSTDLTSLIFQCQNRMVFKSFGPDADVLATEFASMTHDPMRIKDELFRRCQRISGHKIIELMSRSFSQQEAENWSKTYGTSWSKSRGETWNENASRSRSEHQSLSRRDSAMSDPTRSRSGGSASQEGKSRGGSNGSTEGGSETNGSGGSLTSGWTESFNQSLLAEYEEYLERASRTYWTFDEDRVTWGKSIRQLRTGQCVLQQCDNRELYFVDVMRTAPGHLSEPWDKARRRNPKLQDNLEALLEWNFSQDCFVTPEQVEREAAARIQRVLYPPIEISTEAHEEDDVTDEDDGVGN